MTHGTSFSKLLESTLLEYDNHLKANDFNENLTDEDHLTYQEEISSLLNELLNRINDKYQFQMLKMVVPEILEDKNFMEENVLRDLLKVSIVSNKTRLKRNGYCAIYVILKTPDNRKIEIQFQTDMRYKDSKIGSSDHSRMDNKQLDISPFFELKNCDKSDENYSTLFNDTLHILDTTTIAEKNRLFATPIQNLSMEEKKHRRQIEFALKNIQLKEFYENKIVLPDGSQQTISTYTIETYLPIFAQHHSPELIAVSSAHSRVNENIAFVNRKTLIDNFREKLLKTDETTCLADILLKRLQEIQKKDTTIALPESNIREILQSNGVPEYAINTIIADMERSSRTIRFPYTNSVSDIKEHVQKEDDAVR